MKRKILIMAVAFLALLSINQNAFAQCGPAQTELTMTIDFSSDNFPDEDGWRLVDITNGVVIDSACFGTYSSSTGIETITFCVDTGNTYQVLAYDDFGDGLDGSVWTIGYTYGSTISTFGGGNISFADSLCSPQYSNNQIEDTSSVFRAAFVPAPACLTPTANSGTFSLSTTSAGVSWVENGTATSWRVEWDTLGYAGGTARNTMVVTDTFATLTGLMPFTDYDWNVQAYCSPTDSSSLDGSSFYTGYCSVSTSFTSDYLSSVTSTGASMDISYSASTQPSGSYADETAQSLSSFPGAMFDINTNYVGGNNGVTVWVDWNNDLDFDDMGEEIGNASGASAHTISINIPSMAALGNYRMRVRGQWNAVSPPSCGNVSYGSTVDFTLAIAAAPACLSPTANSGNYSISDTSAGVSWTENGTATSWRVEWDTAGYTAGMARNTMVVNTDTFTILTGLTPVTDYDWYVQALCSPTDSSSLTSVQSFSTLASPVGVPYSQNFEGANPLNDFSTSSGSDASLGLDAGSNCAGTNSLFMTGGSFSGWSGSSSRTGTSPTQAWVTNTSKQSEAILTVDATGVTASGLELVFDLKQEWSYGPGYSWARILVNGTQISPDYQPATQNSDPCSSVILDLTPYIGSNFKVTFQFAGKYDDARGNSGQGDNAFFDNIQIVPVSCPDPSMASTFNTTPNSTEVAWMENGTGTSWYLEWDTTGFTPGNGRNSMVVSNDTATLSSLMQSTGYDWYVRTVCAVGDSSRLIGPQSFMTPATCPAPSALSANSLSFDVVEFNWTDNSTAMSWEIEYGAQGFTLGTGTSVITTTNPDTISGLMGNTSYSWYVRAICGAADSSMWTGPNNFTTPCAPLTTPFTEGFSSTSLPACWSQGAGNSENWLFSHNGGHIGNAGNMGSGTTTSGATSTSGMAVVDDSSPHNTSTTLETPFIDISGLTTPELSFFTISDNEGDVNGNVDFHVDIYDGAAWNDSIFFSDTNSLNGTWEKIVIDLNTAVTVTGPIKIRFVVDENNGSGFDDDRAIDDVTVQEKPLCPAPTANAATSVGNDSAVVSWVENGAATQWEVEYGTAGYTVGNGTSTIVNTDTFLTINGLMNATAYDYYVRAICGAADTSTWSTVESFSTTCPAPAATTLPFIEGFETVSANTVVGSNANIVCDPSYSWDFQTAGSTGRIRVGSAAVLASSGSNAATMDVSVSGTFVPNDLILTLDIASFSSATDLELLFDYADHGDEDQPNDSVWVRGSDSDPWVGIYDLNPTTVANGSYNSVGPLDIDAALTAAGQTPSTTFQVRFGQEDNFPATSPTASDGISFDNIVIRQTPTCYAPINLVTSVVTTTSADFSWNDTATVTAPSYEYSYGAPNFMAGTGTQVVVASDSVTVSGLSPSTSYDWYVRAICAPGDTSLWSSVASFATNCVPFIAPITETFDGNSTPTCWSQSAIQGGPWNFGGPGFTWNTQVCSTVPTDHTGNNGSFAALDFSVPDAGVVLEMATVDVTNLTAPYLEFYYTQCNNFTPNNILFVEAFNGTTWNEITALRNGTNGWERFGFLIGNFTYSTNLVTIRFRAEDGGGTQFYGDMGIDDVSIDNAPANDVVASLITDPVSGCGLSSTEAVTLQIINNGGATQTTFSVGYSVNGTPITPETFVGSVASGDTTTYTFTATADLSMAGNYNIVAYTDLTGDIDASNDTTSSVVVSAASISSFPYNESFESGNGNWIVTGNADWELGAPAGVTIDTASDGTQAWVTDLDANYGDGRFGAVNSPCFDFTNIANPFISLDIWYDIESNWDGALLQASTDGGSTWATVGNLDDRMNWYNDSADVFVNLGIAPDGTAWTGDGSVSGVPGTNGWITATNYLEGYGGMSGVQLRMLFASDANTNNDGMAFDNVQIYDRDPFYTIDIINTEDPVTGVADSLGTTCWTSGVVVGIDLDGNNGISFTIIDDETTGTQEGMNIFNFNDVSGYIVTEGDEIMVHGDIIQFRGLTELSPDSIVVLSSGNAIPTPIVVSDLDESTESRWLSIPTNFVSLDSNGAFSSNLRLTNGTDTIVMRIDSDTDINDSLNATMKILPGDTICGLFGIGGQFASSTSAPFTDGYQIFPMRWSDLNICRLAIGIDNVENNDTYFTLYPNPTNGQFVIETSGFNNSSVVVTVRDLSGRLVSSESINNASNAFTKSFDLSNNAKGVYFITIQDGETLINEKLIIN